ncbi:NAD(P)-dependent oxidoreductase [soil metagenome]
MSIDQPSGAGAVAITGAGGFIGSALTRLLTASGHSVVGIDRAPSAEGAVRAAGGEFALGDVTDPASVEAALDGCDAVIHTAARIDDGSDMDEFVRVNVGGTANVLAAAKRAGIERVVHLSSVVVYGYSDTSEQDESAYMRTYGVPYLDTKTASERIARRAGAVVVRPGDVYGPGSVPWVIRPLGLARSRQLAVPRSKTLMLPVYVEDLASAIGLALERGEPGEAYTACNDEAVPFAEYFQRLIELAGAPKPIKAPIAVLSALGTAMEKLDLALGRTPRLSGRAITFIARRGTASNKRARSELGWRPRFDLEEGLRLTAEWARAHGV